jgi:hypothetical protein
LSNGKCLKTPDPCDNASTANPLVIPPISVANRLSVSNVTSHMHPKSAQNLLAHPQNVPTAAATTQPNIQVAPDINNFTILKGQSTTPNA